MAIISRFYFSERTELMPQESTTIPFRGHCHEHYHVGDHCLNFQLVLFILLVLLVLVILREKH